MEKILKILEPLGEARGFTLIEVMMTVFVASISLISILGTNLVLQQANQVTFERVTAVQDAQQAIEQMRDAATYGKFPDNVETSLPAGSDLPGFSNLTDESVTVSYNSLADELVDVTVVVNWTDNQTRPMSYTMKTLLTQRE